jgi:hypothetical protein
MGRQARRFGRLQPAVEKAPRETLEIGRFSSRCVACGNAADPTELQHTTKLGYGGGEGCGVTWTHVRGTYYGPAEEESVREMRPDLVFFP